MKIISSAIRIDKNLQTPVYLQVTNQIISLIQQGILSPGMKLPGTRKLSAQLRVNRNTIVSSFEELEAQGWVETIAAKGSFISSKLPNINPVRWQKSLNRPGSTSSPLLNIPALPDTYLTASSLFKYHFDDGLPDVRLAPLHKLGRHYKSFLTTSLKGSNMYYETHLTGSIILRKALREFLAESRGIHCSIDEIIITRGAIMSFYLICDLIIKPGDIVLVGESSYLIVEKMIQRKGGIIKRIKVDNNGMVIDDIVAIARKQPVKMVYIVPHHHYPTTVTLSPERRVQLLQSAQEFGFSIVEDDYDYDFHYSSSPILPLKSSDPGNHVAYVSSLSKTLAPAFRMGFMVGPKEFIQSAGKTRRFIDRQGDNIVERSVAMLFMEGDIRRHHRKSLIAYKKRRDLLSQLLKIHLGNVVEFTIPEGGMAIWVKWDQGINLSQVREKAKAKDCYITGPEKFSENCIRMGFASMNESELITAVKILKSCI